MPFGTVYFMSKSRMSPGMWFFLARKQEKPFQLYVVGKVFNPFPLTGDSWNGYETQVSQVRRRE